MTFKIEGLDELQRRLEEMSNKAKEIEGEHSVPVTDLLTPEFLSDCSAFSTVEELFEASGFNIKSQEDVEAIPENQWEWFIQQNTSYTSWSEMLQAAGAIWARNKMGL